MTLKYCFKPVVDQDTHVLILGSFPSEISLAQEQYYAHKKNLFWRLIGDVIGEHLFRIDYEARLQALLDHRVGLWDVIATARRKNSLDNQLRDYMKNDLAKLVASLPHLLVIAFNGNIAEKIGMQALSQTSLSLDYIRLPSSSSAYCAVTYVQKLHVWGMLRKWLLV